MGYESNRAHVEAERPDLAKWLVSVQPMRGGPQLAWPMADYPNVLRARRNYDAGTHEMVQGRFGDVIALFSIKRRYPTKAREWFFPSRIKC